MDSITSVQNPLVKSLQKLRQASVRRKEGMFLAEGYKLCEEVLRCNLEVSYCLYCEKDARAADIAAQCKTGSKISVSAAVIAKLSDATTPQGIVMAVKKPMHTDESVEGNLVIALDGISDPANFGTILRTAEAFGVTDILCDASGVDLYNTKVLRGAMGSSFRVRVTEGNLPTLLTEMKEKGYRVLSSFLDKTALHPRDIELSQKTVIVIGNEAHGVSREVCDVSDAKVMIPMKGENESLNAGIAAAIFMWKFFENNL